MDLRVKEYVGGRGISDDDAKRISSFLEQTFGDAPITPIELVEAARPATAAIHRDFEWNDAVAGVQYRLIQARFFLRHIDVVFTNGHDQPKTRAFHQVTLVEDGHEKRAYVKASIVWKDADLAAQVRAKALAELRGWANRFRQYEELSSLIEVVDQLLLEYVRP